MKYDYIVLAGQFIGGAEIFTFEKLQSGSWQGHLVVNPTLAACIAAEPGYADLPLTVLDALEPLSRAISPSSVRTAAHALDAAFGRSAVLLGNMRAGASQLLARHGAGRHCFVHDNSTYLNLKAKALVMLICLRSAMTYFACAHARDAVLWPARAFATLAVEYYGGYRPLPPRAPQLRGALRIISIGRIEPAKGQLYGVQLAARLALQFPDISLSLIGDVRDADYFRQIQDQAQQGGVALRQLVLDHAAVGPHIRRHDLVLHTSIVESLPLVLFEANDSGVPFFSLPAGGIPELLPAGFLLTGNSAGDAAGIGAYFSQAASPHHQA
jgi:glycosyltransferase involved in cell wall biosynthesis